MKQERVALFDLIKGVSMVMVCITHFAWEQSERLELFFPFTISMAVPFFMLVTGYLTAASAERKGLGLRQLYGWPYLRGKLIQFLRPFGLIFLVELVLEALAGHEALSLWALGKVFFTGGFGKYGTYYVPVLLQMLVLFPLVYALLKKDRRNIVLLFLANLAYELAKDSLGITKVSYRLLAFRYLFMISMGCYLYLERGNFSWKKYLPMLAVGGAYVYLASYTDYHRQIFTRWPTTCMITAFYAGALMALALKYGSHLRCPPLEQIGKASYHIFLTQILYYNYFPRIFPVDSRMVRMALGVALSVAVGYGWYRLDRAFLAAYRARRGGSSVPAARK